LDHDNNLLPLLQLFVLHLNKLWVALFFLFLFLLLPPVLSLLSPLLTISYTILAPLSLFLDYLFFWVLLFLLQTRNISYLTLGQLLWVQFLR
jgi:hypothetical protein